MLCFAHMSGIDKPDSIIKEPSNVVARKWRRKTCANS